jgi:hypothetical protein
MKKAQEDRKRQADFTSGSESSKQFCFVKKRTDGSSQSSPSGQWRRTPLQDKPSGNLQYQRNPQHVPKLKELPPRICYNCRQSGHFANECPNPRQQKQNPGSTKGNRNKKPSFQVKQSQPNFISNLSTREPSLLCLLLSNLGTRFCFRGVDCVAPGF